MTGRPAVPGRDDPPTGAVDGGEHRRTRARPPLGGAVGPRGGAVAPHPRPGAGGPDDRAEAEVEPTTGAPVDAVPRRVPVRQPHRWHRRGPDADPDAGPVFWAPIEEVHWDGTPLREEPAGRRDRTPREGRSRRVAARPPRPPEPHRGLAVVVTLSLVAAFFGWVSAGPFWLAVGHATRGAVVIGDCTGDGLGQRCRGIFTAEGERFRAYGVRVSGVPRERATAGATLPARMTGAGGGTAYADTGIGRHLRWLLGLLLVVACGAGIARWSGATRLPDPRTRRWAVVGAFGGPLLITVGFLVAAW
ncbi:hypothetical protein [Micromonospora mirobrigensis]|uniref:hypothetical protein n=1 Tax=Micromonospora mirobrigensis TaxID=262898 RepID=UPI001FE0D4E9|nr:hypothetical protein [Micromonospora mirobrigensis]